MPLLALLLLAPASTALAPGDNSDVVPVTNGLQKKIVQLGIFRTGAEGFEITGVTTDSGDWNVEIKQVNGGYRVVLNGCLDPGESDTLFICWKGPATQAGKTWIRTEDDGVFDGLNNTFEVSPLAFIDSKVVFGGPDGRVFLGIPIAPGEYGYFYQITNDDPAQFIDGMCVDVSHDPYQDLYEFGALDRPHDGSREARDGNAAQWMPRTAYFEQLGPVPGHKPVSWSYDPVEQQACAFFQNGIAPGERSNVFYFKTPQLCDPTNLPLSTTFTLQGVVLHPSLAPTAAPVEVYCTAKANLACGTPGIGASGVARASSLGGPGRDFNVYAIPTRGQKTGLWLYTNAGRANLPFQGGTLCIDPAPLRRSSPVSSGGTQGSCNGVFQLDVNAFASGSAGGNPEPFLRNPGETINCQWWGRDSVATGSFLSDALEYVVYP